MTTHQKHIARNNLNHQTQIKAETMAVFKVHNREGTETAELMGHREVVLRAPRRVPPIIHPLRGGQTKPMSATTIAKRGQPC